MIILDRQLQEVLANRQQLKVVSWGANLLDPMKMESAEWVGHIDVAIFDENGVFVKIDTLSFKGVDYDSWFDKFNTGRFNMERYLRDRHEEVVELPEEEENRYYNKPRGDKFPTDIIIKRGK